MKIIKLKHYNYNILNKFLSFKIFIVFVNDRKIYSTQKRKFENLLLSKNINVLIQENEIKCNLCIIFVLNPLLLISRIQIKSLGNEGINILYVFIMKLGKIFFFFFFNYLNIRILRGGELRLQN